VPRSHGSPRIARIQGARGLRHVLSLGDGDEYSQLLEVISVSALEEGWRDALRESRRRVALRNSI